MRFIKRFYKQNQRSYFQVVSQCCAGYCRNLIESADQRNIFRVLDSVLDGKKGRALALPEDGVSESPDKFSNFFRTKIERIRQNFSSVTPSELTVLPHTTHWFGSFESVSVNFITKPINKLPSKFCSLDPIPTSLLKHCVEQVAPIITHIVNSSLRTGVFPDDCKHALVRPILKSGKHSQNDCSIVVITGLSLICHFYQK